MSKISRYSDNVEIKMEITINGRRTGITQWVSNAMLKDMSRDELIIAIGQVLKHCQMKLAHTQYDAIFRELNGLQKLQKVAKGVKDEQ